MTERPLQSCSWPGRLVQTMGLPREPRLGHFSMGLALRSQYFALLACTVSTTLLGIEIVLRLKKI
jgi:hypothetical protein